MTQIKDSAGRAQITLEIYVAQRLAGGEDISTVRRELISQGLDPKVVDQVLGVAVLQALGDRWKGGIRGWAFRIGGWLVMLSGFFLWLGNRKGFFPTYPFAGSITVTIGVVLLILGGGLKFR
jgi:hypothetical protein